jgi:glycosyltransferase involved in cell wall biosynthesis
MSMPDKITAADDSSASGRLDASGQSISLCICTMNRPDDLRRCLESVRVGSELPDEIIVSDDSRDAEPGRAVVDEFSNATHVVGPRRGLGPNRNACIRRASGNWIAFIDDDVIVPPTFISTIRSITRSAPARTIVTGYEINRGSKVTPHNTDFWGVQRVPANGEYRGIVINATVFPRSLFQEAMFDEVLRYGCDESDIAQHACSLGYVIRYCDELFVHHHPSGVNRSEYENQVHASRLYATWKAHRYYRKSPLNALAYSILGPVQLVGSAIKRRDIRMVITYLQAIRAARALFAAAGAGKRR